MASVQQDVSGDDEEGRPGLYGLRSDEGAAVGSPDAEARVEADSLFRLVGGFFERRG